MGPLPQWVNSGWEAPSLKVVMNGGDRNNDPEILQVFLKPPTRRKDRECGPTLPFPQVAVCNAVWPGIIHDILNVHELPEVA
jgi:hypothetical protein